MNKIDKKRAREQQVVDKMIGLYCRKKHSGSPTLCKTCSALRDYAHLRSERCPFMENKTFCSNCKVHCYSKEKREQIRSVMMFSGPRMILHYPHLAIWHIICSIREKKKAV